AAGSAWATSPRPPDLLYGATSEATERMFTPPTLPGGGAASTADCDACYSRDHEGPVPAIRGVVPRGGGGDPRRPQRHGSLHRGGRRATQLPGGAPQGIRPRGLRLLREPRLAEIPGAGRESFCRAQLLLEAAGAAGADRGPGDAGDRR